MKDVAGLVAVLAGLLSVYSCDAWSTIVTTTDTTLPAIQGNNDTHCEYPGHPNGTSVVRTTLQDFYATGEFVLYQCITGYGGKGHLIIYCRDGQWTTPTRNCYDTIPLSRGCIAGITVAVFNVTVVIISIFFARKERISPQLLKVTPPSHYTMRDYEPVLEELQEEDEEEEGG